MNERERIADLVRQLKEMERQRNRVLKARDQLFIEVRDQFAMAALTGLIAQTDTRLPVKTFVDEAYKVADAMMAKRK